MTTIQISPEIWTNKLKNPGFFLFLTGSEHCVSLAEQYLYQSCMSQFFLLPRNLRHLMTDLTINFACKSGDRFQACTIENWTVVSRGCFFTRPLIPRKCSLCLQGKCFPSRLCIILGQISTQPHTFIFHSCFDAYAFQVNFAWNSTRLLDAEVSGKES